METQPGTDNDSKLHKCEFKVEFRTGTYVSTRYGQALYIGLESETVAKVRHRGKVRHVPIDEIEPEKQYVPESRGSVGGCKSSQTY